MNGSERSSNGSERPDPSRASDPLRDDPARDDPMQDDSFQKYGERGAGWTAQHVPFAPDQVRPDALLQHPRVEEIAFDHAEPDFPDEEDASDEASPEEDASSSRESPAAEKQHPVYPAEGHLSPIQERLARASLQKAARIASNLKGEHAAEDLSSEAPAADEDSGKRSDTGRASKGQSDTARSAEARPPAGLSAAKHLAATIEKAVAQTVHARVPMRPGDVVQPKRRARSGAPSRKKALITKVTAYFRHPLHALAGSAAAHPVSARWTRASFPLDADAPEDLQVEWHAEGWYLTERGATSEMRASLQSGDKVEVLSRGADMDGAANESDQDGADATEHESEAGEHESPEPDGLELDSRTALRLLKRHLQMLALSEAPAQPGDLIVARSNGPLIRGRVSSVEAVLEAEAPVAPEVAAPEASRESAPRKTLNPEPDHTGRVARTVPHRQRAWTVDFRIGLDASDGASNSEGVAEEERTRVRGRELQRRTPSPDGPSESAAAEDARRVLSGLSYWEGCPTTHPAGMRITEDRTSLARVQPVQSGSTEELPPPGEKASRSGEKASRWGAYAQALRHLMKARGALEETVRSAIDDATSAGLSIGESFRSPALRERLSGTTSETHSAEGPSLDPIPAARQSALPLLLREVGGEVTLSRAALSSELSNEAPSSGAPSSGAPTARGLRFWFGVSGSETEEQITVWSDDPILKRIPELEAVADALRASAGEGAAGEGAIHQALREYESTRKREVRRHIERTCPLSAGDVIRLPGVSLNNASVQNNTSVRGTVLEVHGDFLPAMTPALWWWATVDLKNVNPQANDAHSDIADPEICSAKRLWNANRQYSLLEGEPYEEISS